MVPVTGAGSIPALQVSLDWLTAVLAPVAVPQGTGTQEEQLEGLH